MNLLEINFQDLQRNFLEINFQDLQRKFLEPELSFLELNFLKTNHLKNKEVAEKFLVGFKKFIMGFQKFIMGFQQFHRLCTLLLFLKLPLCANFSVILLANSCAELLKASEYSNSLNTVPILFTPMQQFYLVIIDHFTQVAFLYLVCSNIIQLSWYLPKFIEHLQLLRYLES